MSLKKIGTIFPKDTRTRFWWIKLGISLVLSNILFFLLFGSSKESPKYSDQEKDWVEIQMEAEILTPIIEGKKVLLLNKRAKKKIEGILKTAEVQESGKITVSIKEEEAHILIQYEAWQVLPYLKNLPLTSFQNIQNKVHHHEIYY